MIVVTGPRVLVVEDSQRKYDDIVAVLQTSIDLGSLLIERAPTLIAAEQLLTASPWALLVLDVSMDIVASRAGPRQGGHATTGGLSIARRMYLTGVRVPTVVVTAFDSFQGKQVERGKFVMIGLDEVVQRARSDLGEGFMGCVRYGAVGWDVELRECARKAISL